MLTDIDIAQRAKLLPIGDIATRLGIPDAALEPYGHTKAKVSLDWLAGLAGRPDGKLILVSAISPTPAGEGKTTTTVGLGDALNRIGKKAAVCLREPSLGPVFGMKGGAAGGGYAQVVPMEDINLHFTGDFHAIGVANNLLAALLDNHIHHGNALDIDVRRIAWKRVDRHERPRAARHHRRAGRAGQRLSAPGRLRHRRRVRGDGDLLPVVFARRPQGAPGQDRRRLHPRPEARSRARPAGARRDDGAAQGCVEAEPRADAREQPGVHPRRPLRQHRARLQLGDRDQGGAEARRLRRHGGRVRRRPRRGEVHRHQVPQVRSAAQPRRAGRDDPRAQVPRRRRREGAHARESAGAGEGRGQPRAPHQQRPQPLRHALRGRDQPLHVGHRRRDRAAPEEGRPSRRAGRRWRGTGRMAAPAPRSSRGPRSR